MVFDYKKEYKELYQAKAKPHLVDVPEISYVAVRGQGNPNQEKGEYAEAITALYAISYTIRMSHKAGREIAGYFEYVVPPLEGLWWLADGSPGMDYANKGRLAWIAMIRLPEFVTEEVFEWAKTEASRKKQLDTSKAELFRFTEGMSVQILHQGPYDAEPATVALMDAFLETTDYKVDLSPDRHHHEIYLSDPRKTEPEKLRTIIRHPIAIRSID